MIAFAKCTGKPVGILKTIFLTHIILKLQLVFITVSFSDNQAIIIENRENL
jgi:hypothetical protein